MFGLRHMAGAGAAYGGITGEGTGMGSVGMGALGGGLGILGGYTGGQFVAGAAGMDRNMGRSVYGMAASAYRNRGTASIMDTALGFSKRMGMGKIGMGVGGSAIRASVAMAGAYFGSKIATNGGY